MEKLRILWVLILSLLLLSWMGLREAVELDAIIWAAAVLVHTWINRETQEKSDGQGENKSNDNNHGEFRKAA